MKKWLAGLLALIVIPCLCSFAPAAKAAVESEQATRPDPAYILSGDTLTHYLADGREFTVPDGVRIISANAFRYSRHLEVLILPDSVEEIRKQAFADCSSLRVVRVSERSRLRTIGARAFWNCPLEDLSFASGASDIAEDAFGADPVPEPYSGPWFPSPPHSPGTGAPLHGYGQVSLAEVEAGTVPPLKTLTLAGEEQALSLEGLHGNAPVFTCSISSLRSGEKALLLRAWAEAPGDEYPASCCWTFGGELLRRLNRSGVPFLALSSGDTGVVFPTAGFLAGWQWEEMRSRGVSEAAFTYRVELDPTASSSPVLSVTVENETRSLSWDSHAGLYLTGFMPDLETLREKYPGIIN